MGLTQAGAHPHSRNEIGIFRMHHGSIGNRRRQIKRHAAPQSLCDISSENSSLIIKAYIIGNLEIMAFSSNPHIFIPVIDQLGRLTCFLGRQCRDNRRQVCLTFLAAKGATHPAHLNRNLMKAKP